MSMLLSKGTFRTAGSRLMTYGGSLLPWRWALIRCMKVVFPDPGDGHELAGGGLKPYVLTSHPDTDDGDWPGGATFRGLRFHICWLLGDCGSLTRTRGSGRGALIILRQSAAQGY